MAASRQRWLIKSEPSVYSIDDLEREGVTCWEGIRNYQARNFIRDEMKVGDEALFYHSSADPTGVVGVARVCKRAYPDSHAWDKKSKYFDERSTPENPVWLMVDVEFVRKYPRVVTLAELKEHAELEGLQVLRKGNRLSIQPVSAEHFEFIDRLGRKR